MRFSIDPSQSGGWQQLRLSDSESSCSVEIIPAAGGILNAFRVRQDDGEVNVIDGFEHEAEWKETLEQGFRSSKLSPFVCRIAQARYTWEGREYNLRKFHLNGAALHGLIYDAPFEVIEKIVNNRFAEVELRYTYPGFDPGYPFPYDCYIRYRLEPGNSLLVTTAIHNRSKHPIPVADGWHPYFGFGGDIGRLTLQFHASAELEYDAQLIPTGKTKPVSSFTVPTLLGATALDNGYVLDFTREQPLCTLADPSTGLAVEFHPDRSYPYLQLYTPPHRRSIAIENLSAAPDAFNNRIGLVTLEPDHTKTFTVRYKVRV
jgi:aldose 1-epimerase